MNNFQANYNERAWAIDLIGYLKRLANQDNRSIKDVGGEQSVRVEGGHLFPDVLLFGDRVTARILQGWELKMPDTNINDLEFLRNAEIKARALGLDSFLLWNVSQARLYTKDSDTDTFVLNHIWEGLIDITQRRQVLPNRNRWEALAAEIYNYLNDLFDRGTLEGRQFIEAYRSGGVTALIMENTGEVETHLMAESRRNAILRAEITLWWDKYRAEYGGTSMSKVMAQAIISNWIGKILFAQILRERDERARAVALIDEDKSPAEALEIFSQLSQTCNFWTIFSDNFIGLSLLPEKTWNQLRQFNYLLNDLRVGSVDQAQLSGILEATVEVTTRKLRGQYPTPIELAQLLVSLCLRNPVLDRFLDPCCGSGTIVRAAVDQKLLAGVDARDISKSIYASDQDPQAIQIATFALARPNLMHEPLRIFQKDVFTLNPQNEIDFRNPSNGESFTEQLGVFEAIVSNLPFVAQNGRKQYENAMLLVKQTIGAGKKQFTKRADISAYIPFSLYPLLQHEGRLGLIITNAWLGTEWGDHFYQNLKRYYNIKSIITSGAGRWFRNSDVVTNILILEKKEDEDIPNGVINFVVLKIPIEEFRVDETIEVVRAQIEVGRVQNDSMTLRSISTERLELFRKLGLGGSAQFVNCDWILDLPLVPVNRFFTIRRGERRGENKLFYPKGNHGIEPEYIRPLAKDLKGFRSLIGQATKEAFCCAESEERLEELGHMGALNWIRRFKTPQNIAKLGKGGKLWYSMDADRQSDMVMTINYNQRIFVPRLSPLAFADQRLVPFDPLEDVDVDLCHALLNSTIAMFIIEGIGFGRGLGVLDLNKDRIENYMHILDPARLTEEKIIAIKAAFLPLLDREILEIADELEQEDRRAFDDVVIQAFNINLDMQIVYDSLLTLVEIRMSALD